MEKYFVLLIVLIPVISFTQTYKKHLQKARLTIQLSEGVMNITAVSDKAIYITSFSINN